ncbi:MAG: GntR family transcriptional regulator [Kiritimatiellae bacterium]|nr:GntR family transcriptional regulator [Kiritimatiellia bacterium]
MENVNSSYREILELLRSEILGGKFSSASKFPSSMALARRFKTTRFTVRQALDRLRQEGLIVAQKGRGTFVSQQARSRLVGVVIPGISYSSEFFQPIIASLLKCAHERDYTILMEGVWTPNAQGNSEEALSVARRLVERKVAGVIYQPIEYSQSSEAANRRVLEIFSKAGIPVVLFDGDIVAYPNRSDFDLVSIDNVAAGETLGLHMLERGAKNVYFLMRENWVQNVRNRARGVGNIIRAMGGEWKASNVVYGDPLDAEFVGRIMRKRPKPDAFVCENDVLAAGLKMTLERIGINVPRAVMVAGFDDVQVARITPPGLTTIRQPLDMIAQVTFKRLCERMTNPSACQTPFHIVCPFALVVRGTTCKDIS